jgi:nicotinamidase-related amidase
MTNAMANAAFVVLFGLAALVVPGVEGRSAFLVVDVQNCFLEPECTSNGQEGSLAVPACGIIPKINQIRAEKSCLFDEVIFTRDFHPAGHISYASTHGLAPFSGNLPLTCISPSSGRTSDGACCPTYYLNQWMDCSANLCPPSGWDYDAVVNNSIVANNTACSVCAESPDTCFQMEQAMWTDHCLQTGDSTFPDSLDKRETDTVVEKGTNQYVDAYSGFMDNAQTLKTGLDSELQSMGIDTLYIAGIATDVCVQWTVRDALGNHTGNYDVTVIKDATAPVAGNQENYNAAIGAMAAQGAKIVTASDVLARECPNHTSGSVRSSTLGALLVMVIIRSLL